MNQVNGAGWECRTLSRRASFFISGPIRLLAMLVAVGATGIALGQQLPDAPLPVDPTPLNKLLSDQELASLAKAQKPKELTELLINISDAHLAAADKALEAGDTTAAERELDIHNKAAAAASDAAFRDAKEKRKLGKILEQRLYAQLRLLEGIQRRFPADLVGYAEAAIRRTKELRDHALNETLAVGNVIDEHPEKNKEKQPPLKPQRFDSQLLAGGSGSRRVRPVSDQMAGDYMTEDEEDKVREAQEVDQRTKVFLKIANRRLDAIGHPPVVSDEGGKGKKKKKDGDDERGWGPVPNVSKAELLTHYSKAIAELEDKLDDANHRNPRSSALKSALTILRDGTEKQLAVLSSLDSQLQSDEEKRALRTAISTAEEAHNGAVEGLKSR